MRLRSLLWRGSAALTALALALYLGSSLFAHDRRSVFLPGDTTSAHYQIEMACESCHTRSFSGKEDLQKACVRCHGEQLEAARDSHPKSKFTDPRNAEYVAILDARYCVTCHREHQPRVTLSMALTLPADYCFHCHSEIGDERKSHRGLSFASCAQSGCHNFHDNRGLYEDFLKAHLGEPAQRAGASLPVRALALALDPAKALRLDQFDAPAAVKAPDALVRAWADSAHGRGAVNCSRCHGEGRRWVARPDSEACRECHGAEVAGFLAGRHGMRSAAGLEPMRPALARLPMKVDAANRTLGCAACHGAHELDTRRAAAAACLECHDDAHSRAYPASRHAALWDAEIRGELEPGRGVSCASCHLPRHAGANGGVAAEHDQSGNLHPSEEMARTVCNACHGLQFSFDSLADSELVRRNFAGSPSRRVESLDWVAARESDESNAKKERSHRHD